MSNNFAEKMCGAFSVQHSNAYTSATAYKNTSTGTVKILKIGTPEIITIIVLQLEQWDFTVQYCVQKMQTE